MEARGALKHCPSRRTLERSLSAHAERLGHEHELGKRLRVHLSHDVAAVDLNRYLGDAHLGGNLLVHESGGDQRHDLPLARGQLFEEPLELFPPLRFLAPFPDALERDCDRVEQILIAERLDHEINSSSLHSPHGHCNIAVPGDENYRNFDVRLGELGLKIETAALWQSDVEHKTTGDVRQLGL